MYVFVYSLFLNNDDNIHKSEALKWQDKRTLRLVSELKKPDINACISLNKFVSKFVA